MSAIKNRYEAMFYLACRNGNPNGDPDMGNLPRMDPETGIGYITDVSTARHVRDFVQAAYAGVPGMEIFHQREAHLGKAISELCEAAGCTAKPDKRTKDELEKTRAAACERFYDTRTFGAVMSTGTNAGQVQGPVQFAFGFSLDPIQGREITITRSSTSKLKGGGDEQCKTPADYAAAEAVAPADKLRTMGSKQFIPFGLYEMRVFVSANLAAQTGFDDNDLMTLFQAITRMYDQVHSSSKGEMYLASPLVIFKHVGDPSRPADEQIRQAVLGRAPSDKLFGLSRCELKSGIDAPRSHTDYSCSIDLSHTPDGIEIGFLPPYADAVTWGRLPDSEAWMTSI